MKISSRITLIKIITPILFLFFFKNLNAQYSQVFYEEYNSANVSTSTKGVTMDDDNNSYHVFNSFANNESSFQLRKHTMSGNVEWTKELDIMSFRACDSYNNEVYMLTRNNFGDEEFNSINKNNGELDSIFSLNSLYGYYLTINQFKVSNNGFVIAGSATTNGFNNMAFVALFDFQGNIVWSRFDIDEELDGWYSNNNGTRVTQIQIHDDNLIVHTISDHNYLIHTGSPNGDSNPSAGLRVLDLNSGNDLFIAEENKKDYSPMCFTIDNANNMYFSSHFWNGNFLYSSIEKLDLDTYSSVFLDSILMLEFQQNGDFKITDIAFHENHLYAHGRRSSYPSYDAKLYKINLDGTLDQSVPVYIERGFKIIGNGNEFLIIYQNEDGKQSIDTYDNDLNLLNQETHSNNGNFHFISWFSKSNSGCFAFAGDFYPVAGSSFRNANLYHYCTATAGLSKHYDDTPFYNLYPNPSSSSVNIEFNKPLQTELELTVITLEGRKVISNKLNKNTLNTIVSVDELSSGTYLIKIGNEVKKVVVE